MTTKINDVASELITNLQQDLTKLDTEIKSGQDNMILLKGAIQGIQLYQQKLTEETTSEQDSKTKNSSKKSKK